MRKKKKNNSSSLLNIIGIVALIGVTVYYALASRQDTVNAQEESMKLIYAVEQMRDAQLDYFSKHKSYAKDLSLLLDKDGKLLPFIPPGTKGAAQAISVKNGWDYEARIYRSSETFGISALYTEGRFKNSGFFLNFQGISEEPAGEIMCKEPIDVPRSDYCKNFMGYSKLFAYRPEYRVYKKVSDFEDITGEEK